MGQVRNPRVGQERTAPEGHAIIKGDGKLRKMRCPRCHAMMAQTHKPDGTPIYRCNCGNEMACTRM
jgi:NAD-dependent SIR2 family protein deacetylase